MTAAIGVFAMPFAHRIATDEANGDDFNASVVGFVASKAFISVPETS